MIAPAIEPSPRPELEASFGDRDDNRSGGGGHALPPDPPEPPFKVSELDPVRPPTAASAARLFTYFAMFWIFALFSTIALAMDSRWVHSSDWFSIPLPRSLVANAVVLLVSSTSIEFARFSVRAGEVGRAVRWIFVTVLLGVVFLSGQTLACWEFLGETLRLAPNPGASFFYVTTGAHSILLLVGIVFLAAVGFSIHRTQQTSGSRSALGTVALYWHFMAGLWICLLGLLLATIQ